MTTATQSPPPVMRRFSLFVDGMARAIILPFGPSLVHRLVYGSVEIEVAAWSGVVYYLALVIAVYIVGRWLGSSLASSFQLWHAYDDALLPIYIARLGGVALSLHVFTYGAGLASVRWLVAIRFLSATLAGLLCGFTNHIALPEDVWTYRKAVEIDREEPAEAGIRRREGYVDVASGTAKIYLTGFAISILSGGLLFRKATKDSTFRALTGASRYSWSPLFLVGVSVSLEIVLRGLFALASKPDVVEENNGAAGKVRKVFRRIVSDDKTSSHQDSKPLITTVPLHLIIDDEDEAEEDAFIDPLSMSVTKQNRKSTFATPMRSRMESNNSIDEFFDCQSAFSDVENAEVHSAKSTNEMEIAQYVNGRCLYNDGSAASVPPGDCIASIPPNYLLFYNGNDSKARKAWRKSQAWRLERHVWKVHTIPNKWFAKIKQAYPHYVHGHSKSGFPIVYERPGRMNLRELFQSGCEISDMIQHYIFFMEFIANRVCTQHDVRAKLGSGALPHSSSSWGTIVVLDVKGVGLSSLSGDVIKYLKQAGEVNSSHYPMTMKRAFVINSPFWLSGAWSSLKGILPDSVQVDILSERSYAAALSEYIDESEIPPEFGGTSPYELGEHPYELQLCSLVDEISKTGDRCSVLGGKEVLPTNETSLASNGLVQEQQLSPLGLSPPRTRSLSESRPLRRRVGSVERVPLQRTTSQPIGSKVGQNKFVRREIDVFTIVSIMHVLWGCVQGALEIALPLWLLSPVRVGGLGYSPSRSGVAIFSACLVLLCAFRTKSSRLVSQIPSREPMRGFRVGIGSQSVLLALLATVSARTIPMRRTDSVFVMASTIVIFACLSLSGILGRSSSTILHRIASDSFTRIASTETSWLTKRYGKDQLIRDCESGKFTTFLDTAGEIMGIILVAPLWSWSMAHARPAPFDSSCVIFVTCLVTCVLYVCSFSLHLNNFGEFAPHPKDSCTGTRRCVPFVTEVIAVSAGDMASLFEEANWSSTQLLGGAKRSRAFSELSTGVEAMELGEALSSDGIRKFK